MTEYSTGNTFDTAAGPGLVLILRPVRGMAELVERAGQSSTREYTAKDFIDLLEYAGALLWLCPERPEFAAPGEHWRAELPQHQQDPTLERTIVRGGRDSRNFVLLLQTGTDSQEETARWRELLVKIIRKYF